jgi:aspartyl-tRNA(Asn)/glutamyl-tRNA(Gln) amidotransferase subunit A
MPAHCCGLMGFKPSYGRVSRFGLISYSSSSDVNGPFAHSVEDLHSIFHQIQGFDENDSTCINFNQLDGQTYRGDDR